MSDHGWRFNEEDEWDDPEEREEQRTTPAEDMLTGQDPHRVVTVHVTPSGDVVSVRLAADWKKTVRPHDLHSSVLSAANAATMQALARQVENTPVQPGSAASGTTGTSSASHSSDETPITKEDALRLLDAVTADLEQFSRQLSAITDQAATAESSGRHVSGSGQRGQVLRVSLDENWAGRARNSEIESELLDFLENLQNRMSLGALAQGPQSSAIAELQDLVSDPQRLLRRVGLAPRSPSTSEE